MLDRAAARAGDGVTFVPGDIANWGEGTDGAVDVVFSNAALQWVPDHPHVVARWRDALRPGGQLAVQVPTNADHASHRVIRELAADWFGADAPPDPVEENVLRPEQYAELLDRLGFERQHVRLQVYAHHMHSTDDVVEWVRGTSLTRFTSLLPPDDDGRFVAEYRARLHAALGERAPYFYAFKRILFWGRLPR